MTTILRVISGSRAYGTALPDSDTDYRGVFVAPPEQVIGPWRGGDAMNGDGQDDRSFELRRFMQMAADANPNIIEMLFVPKSCIVSITPAGLGLVHNRRLFLSKRIGTTFAGFARSNLKRIASGHTRTGQRAEMEQFGWDTKYGMHAVRVLQTGIDALRTGDRMPVQRDNAAELLAIRRGVYSRDQVVSWIESLLCDIESAVGASRLPDEPNRTKLTELCLELTNETWESE